MRWPVLIALAAAILGWGPGCATRQPVRALPPPLSEQDVLSLHAAGVSDGEILRRIAESRSVYYLAAEDIARLREAGLSDALVTGMIETRARNAARAAVRNIEDSAGAGSRWPRIHLGGSVVYTK